MSSEKQTTYYSPMRDAIVPDLMASVPGGDDKLATNGILSAKISYFPVRMFYNERPAYRIKSLGKPKVEVLYSTIDVIKAIIYEYLFRRNANNQYIIGQFKITSKSNDLNYFSLLSIIDIPDIEIQFETGWRNDPNLRTNLPMYDLVYIVLPQIKGVKEKDVITPYNLISAFKSRLIYMITSVIMHCDENTLKLIVEHLTPRVKFICVIPPAAIVLDNVKWSSYDPTSHELVFQVADTLYISSRLSTSLNLIDIFLRTQDVPHLNSVIGKAIESRLFRASVG